MQNIIARFVVNFFKTKCTLFSTLHWVNSVELFLLQFIARIVLSVLQIHRNLYNFLHLVHMVLQLVVQNATFVAFYTAFFSGLSQTFEYRSKSPITSGISNTRFSNY